MNEIKTTYTNEEAKAIIDDIKKLCNNSYIASEKLIELFEYPNQDNNLKKLEAVIYMIDGLEVDTFEIAGDTYSLKDELMIDSIDILEEYEYFKSKIDNKSKYDKTKLQQQFKYLGRFITNNEDIQLRLPEHPNHLYKNNLALFLYVYKLSKGESYNILDELLDGNANKQITKEYKQGVMRKINQYKKEMEHSTSIEEKVLKKKIANLNKLFS